MLAELPCLRFGFRAVEHDELLTQGQALHVLANQDALIATLGTGRDG